MVLPPYVKLISHRGNIEGPVPETENQPDYVDRALAQGFDVEVDVWRDGDYWRLGHDAPQYYVPFSFLDRSGIWAHCKNFEALLLLRSSRVHHFWHENDVFARTSAGYLWTTHWIPEGQGVITMCTGDALPEQAHLLAVSGVCSDYIGRLK